MQILIYFRYWTIPDQNMEKNVIDEIENESQQAAQKVKGIFITTYSIKICTKLHMYVRCTKLEFKGCRFSKDWFSVKDNKNDQIIFLL